MEKQNIQATQLLPRLGQSDWLDIITRELLNNAALKRYSQSPSDLSREDPHERADR
jgi:hypothetical protein